MRTMSNGNSPSECKPVLEGGVNVELRTYSLAYAVVCCGGVLLNGEPRPAIPRVAEAREADQHHGPS